MGAGSPGMTGKMRRRVALHGEKAALMRRMDKGLCGSS